MGKKDVVVLEPDYDEIQNDGRKEEGLAPELDGDEEVRRVDAMMRVATASRGKEKESAQNPCNLSNEGLEKEKEEDTPINSLPAKKVTVALEPEKGETKSAESNSKEA